VFVQGVKHQHFHICWDIKFYSVTGKYLVDSFIIL
jgi:hypothetical protein